MGRGVVVALTFVVDPLQAALKRIRNQKFVDVDKAVKECAAIWLSKVRGENGE